MNYIELINNVWNLREQGLITSYECDLYLYLVHRCNRLGWRNPFVQPTDITCAVLRINRNALISRRNRLKQLGLIDFKEGERKTKPPTYILCSLKDTQADMQNFTPATTQTDTHPSIINKNKIKQNKTAYESEKEVDYQFVISVFNETCKSLPKVSRLTEQRRQKIADAARYIGIDKLFKCFKIAEESYFLSKRKGKWRATFDWILEPENMVKILEGSYNSKGLKDDTSSNTKQYFKRNEEQYGADKWAEAAAFLDRNTA